MAAASTMAPTVLRLLLPLLATTAQAQVDGDQLQRFLREAEAFNAEAPQANRYRAGFYHGYVNGIVDALQGESVCLTGCRCEIDGHLARHLAAHPEDLDKPAAAIVRRVLQAAYPCR